MDYYSGGFGGKALKIGLILLGMVVTILAAAGLMYWGVTLLTGGGLF